MEKIIFFKIFNCLNFDNLVINFIISIEFVLFLYFLKVGLNIFVNNIHERDIILFLN